MKRTPKKKNFILVAEIMSNRVRAIIEGHDERFIKGKHLINADRILIHKMEELNTKFLYNIYDVMWCRAVNLDDLKRQYPELSGWENINVETIQ